MKKQNVNTKEYISLHIVIDIIQFY